MSEPSLDIEAALAGRDKLLRDACDRALRYLGALADRPVAPGPAAVTALAGLDFALPAGVCPRRTCSACSTRPGRGSSARRR